MDFANERYVRLYVRDTTTWLLLEFEGQTVLMHMLRKADRAGVIDLAGREPWQAPVVHCRIPSDFARKGMDACLREGVIVHDGDRLVFPRYIEANETAMSDKQRSKESRAKRAALVTKRDAESQNVTAPSQNVSPASHAVTDSHSASHGVTPCRAVPYRAEEESERDSVTIRDTASMLRVGFERRFMAKKAASPNQKALGAAIPQLVQFVETTAELRKQSGGELVDRLLDAFFANDNAASKSFPPAFLANNPLEYLDAKPQLRAARVPDGIPPIKNFGPRKETA